MGLHLHLCAQDDVWYIGRFAARMSANGRELPLTCTFGSGYRRCQRVFCMCVVVVLVSSTHQTRPNPCCSVGCMLLSCCLHGVMMCCCSILSSLLLSSLLSSTLLTSPLPSSSLLFSSLLSSSLLFSTLLFSSLLFSSLVFSCDCLCLIFYCHCLCLRLVLFYRLSCIDVISQVAEWWHVCPSEISRRLCISNDGRGIPSEKRACHWIWFHGPLPFPWP